MSCSKDEIKEMKATGSKIRKKYLIKGNPKLIFDSLNLKDYRSYAVGAASNHAAVVFHPSIKKIF
jgi:hypothetical protein